MKVGSLFSGVGGLDLGLEWAGFEPAWFCDIEPFSKQVLNARWPGVPFIDDVRNITTESVSPIDVLAGGFPCQDLSWAGRGRGLSYDLSTGEGTRSGLWWEMWRIVRDFRPRYVIAENVPALTHRGLDIVLGSLAQVGYDAEWTVVSAASVGAPHIRERVFVVAYPQDSDSIGLGDTLERQDPVRLARRPGAEGPGRGGYAQPSWFGGPWRQPWPVSFKREDVPNPSSGGLEGAEAGRRDSGGNAGGSGDGAVCDAPSAGLPHGGGSPLAEPGSVGESERPSGAPSGSLPDSDSGSGIERGVELTQSGEGSRDVANSDNGQPHVPGHQEPGTEEGRGEASIGGDDRIDASAGGTADLGVPRRELPRELERVATVGDFRHMAARLPAGMDEATGGGVWIGTPTTSENIRSEDFRRDLPTNAEYAEQFKGTEFQTPTVHDSHGVTRTKEGWEKRKAYRESIGRQSMAPAGLAEQIALRQENGSERVWPTPTSTKTTKSGDLINADGTPWDGESKPHSASTGKPVTTALADAADFASGETWPTPAAAGGETGGPVGLCGGAGNRERWYELTDGIVDAPIDQLDGYVYTDVPDRTARLKGLGNAVVPQVGYLVGRAVMEHAIETGQVVVEGECG